MFDDPDVSAELAKLHHKYVVVSADKAFNNILQNTLYQLLNEGAWYDYYNREPDTQTHIVVKGRNFTKPPFGYGVIRNFIFDEHLDRPQFKLHS